MTEGSYPGVNRRGPRTKLKKMDIGRFQNLCFDRTETMWSNLSGVVGAAMQKVRELENQLDSAVGVEKPAVAIDSTSLGKFPTSSNKDDGGVANKKGVGSEVGGPQDESKSVLKSISSLEDVFLDKAMSRQSSQLSIAESSNSLADQGRASATPEASSEGRPAKRRVAKSSNHNGTSPSSASPPSDNFHSVAAETDAVVLKLRQELADARQQAETTRSENLALLDDLKTAKEKVLTTQQQAKAKIKQSSEKYEQQISELRSENEGKVTNLQNRLKDEETKRMETSKQLRQVEDILTQKASEITRLQHNLQQALMEKEQLQAAVTNEDTQSDSAKESAAIAASEAANAALQALQESFAQEKEVLISRTRVLEDEIQQLQQVQHTLNEREKALEQQQVQLASAHQTISELSRKVADLTEESAAKDELQRSLQASIIEAQQQASNAQQQLQQQVTQLQQQLQQQQQQQAAALASSASQESAAHVKEILRLQENLRNSEEKLAAYEAEGRNLAKKQSEMEKSVRQSKQTMREKDIEISKLKESKEQLTKVVEQTQDALKKQEHDFHNQLKTLQAMQAVSTASADKLQRLEADLSAKVEELLSQKRALENAWTENNDLKRACSDLKVENDDLRRQLGEGTGKMQDIESTRREIEQREAVLRATSRQLQENMQRMMSEQGQREERLREEVQEMRRKWQEAVANREALASELTQATAPLLRQITTLQESLRLKSDAWQHIETTLSERALRAETLAESHVHKRSLLEEQVHTYQTQAQSLTTRLHDLQTRLDECETLCHKYQRNEATWLEEQQEWRAKWALQEAQHQSLLSSMRDLETSHKVALQEVQERYSLQLQASEQEVQRLRQECQALQEELQNNHYHSSNSNNLMQHSLHAYPHQQTMFSPSHHKNGHNNSLMVSGFQDDFGEDDATTIGASSVTSSSFVASEKAQARHRHRDEAQRALQAQVQQLQVARAALLDEVNFLSNRNAQLEEQVHLYPRLQEECAGLKQQVSVLLLLLGEKEEEVEALTQDLQEVKGMYRQQMDTLLQRCLALEDSNHNNDNQRNDTSDNNLNVQDEDHSLQHNVQHNGSIMGANASQPKRPLSTSRSANQSPVTITTSNASSSQSHTTSSAAVSSLLSSSVSAPNLQHQQQQNNLLASKRD